MKCNKTQSKWCINKHGASKIIDTFETYHTSYPFVDDSALYRIGDITQYTCHCEDESESIE
jgi:hypothetical protein